MVYNQFGQLGSYFKGRSGKNKKKLQLIRANQGFMKSRAWKTWINPVHRFVRTYDTEQALQVTPLIRFQHYCGDGEHGNFHLSILPNYEEFVALYDKYRIVKIKFSLWYTANAVANQASLNQAYLQPYNTLPSIGSVLDHDDDTPLTDRADYEQYSTYKEQRLDKPFHRTLYPRVARMVYNGVASTAYEPAKGATWIDWSNEACPHYAHKWFIDMNVLAQTNEIYILGMIRVVTKYYFECKGTR